MTISNFLRAIGKKLKELYPDKITYYKEIPRDADGNFYARLVDSSQERHLDRRRKRILQFEVLYYCEEKDKMAFLDWAEVMYDNFEQLAVKVDDEGNVWNIDLKNQKAHENNNTMMYQFLFDAEFYFVMKPEEVPLMENLEHTERVRE